MQFTTQTLVAILAATAAAQSVEVASLSGPAASKVSSFLAHVTAEPEYASFSSVAATAVKTKWQQSFLSGDLSKISTKSWYAGLPSDIKSFAESVQSGILKIATASDASASATGSSPSASPSASPTSAASVSKTAVNAASTSAASSAASASKSASSSASKSSSSAAASATKNGAMETGVGKMMGVAAVGALGALML